MNHTCHAHGCTVEVPPKMFMCKAHWFKLRKRTRDAIWAEYTPRQEITKTPSMRYLAVQQYAIGEAAFRPHDEAAALVFAHYFVKALEFRVQAMALGEGDPLDWIDEVDDLLPRPEPAADALHPTGKCKCAGEGRCAWCSKVLACGCKQISCPGCVVTTCKVLSVWGPWAQLFFIGKGAKDVENRPWSTTYRGPVAIHASKGGHPPRDVASILADLSSGDRGRLITLAQRDMVSERVESDRGHIIGVVQLVGAKRKSASPWWVEGEVALEVADPRLLAEPIPYVGRQGLRDYVLVEKPT